MANAAKKSDHDERESFGEAMLACQRKEREFVIQAVQFGRSYADAAREAGYGNEDGTSNANTLARIAYRISHRPRVIDALLEESRKAMRTAVPNAVQAVDEILRDRHHRDRAKVALATIERVDATVQKSELNVNVRVDHEAEALDQLRSLRALNVAREKLIDLYGAFGLERLEKKLALENNGNVVDAEFAEVIRDPDADLLGE